MILQLPYLDDFTGGGVWYFLIAAIIYYIILRRKTPRAHKAKTLDELERDSTYAFLRKKTPPKE